MHHQPSTAEFEIYVRRALQLLPQELAEQTKDVVIRVLEFADNEVLDEMGIDDAYELLGLYQGVSLNHRSVFDTGHEPDFVFLYRQPILAYAAAEGLTLEAVVRNVVIHEIGHHFGFSDDDMHDLEESD